MPKNDDQLLSAITRIVPSMLTAMEAFEQLQRNFHPTHSAQLKLTFEPFEARLREDFNFFSTVEFPPDIAAIGSTLHQAATYALRACEGITGDHTDIAPMMRAMRAHCRAQEEIYALAPAMTPVNQYFLEPEARANRRLLSQLAHQEVAPADVIVSEDLPRGILSVANARTVRGGFSVYVPENLDLQAPTSVVMALHGGTGHGSDFIWSWLREARTRGFILVAPTSTGNTWALDGPDRDLPALLKILTYLRQNWTIDNDHILLTGMSDGASYCLQAGLNPDSPFTHLAPFSGVLHPDIVMQGRLQHAHKKPIYLVHGTLDWMFPVEIARMARAELEQAGADLTYREIVGLSHSYARTENPALIDWFNAALQVPSNA
jgi:phospholipase/carboxylesterase